MGTWWCCKAPFGEHEDDCQNKKRPSSCTVDSFVRCPDCGTILQSAHDNNWYCPKCEEHMTFTPNATGESRAIARTLNPIVGSLEDGE